MMALSIGTSSWNFKEWQGIFYPATLPGNRHLAFYATHFRTVEVNTSFYGLPKPATLVNWIESVPPGFTFSLKAPRSITHEKRLVDCRAETLAYLDALRSLGEACGPGLLQLPPSLTRRSDGRTLAHFLDWLARELADLRIAVEVRSADLMTTAFAQYLAERDMALVLADHEGLSDLWAHWQLTMDSGTYPRHAFIRWIGDDRNGPRGNRELVHLRDKQLACWATRIEKLLQHGIQVYGYMHNTYEGHSPSSVNRLYDLLGKRWTLEEWPPSNWQWQDDDGTSGNQLSLFE